MNTMFDDILTYDLDMVVVKVGRQPWPWPEPLGSILKTTQGVPHVEPKDKLLFIMRNNFAYRRLSTTCMRRYTRQFCL